MSRSELLFVVFKRALQYKGLVEEVFFWLSASVLSFCSISSGRPEYKCLPGNHMVYSCSVCC